MGGIEVCNYWWIIQSLATFIVLLLSIFTQKNLLQRLGMSKVARKDYYECGFRPNTQKPIQMSIQFILICIFFIIYDIELVFSFPLVSSLLSNGLSDLIGFFLIYFTMVISLLFDFDRNLINWKFV